MQSDTIVFSKKSKSRSQQQQPEYVYLKLPLGFTNHHQIEKISVISEQSDSSYESDSSVDMSEDEEKSSLYSPKHHMVYFMMRQSVLNSDGSFNMQALSNR